MNDQNPRPICPAHEDLANMVRSMASDIKDIKIRLVGNPALKQPGLVDMVETDHAKIKELERADVARGAAIGTLGGVVAIMGKWLLEKF